MRTDPTRSQARRTPIAAMAFALCVLPACSEEKPYDWRNRDVDWSYAPQKPTARREHLEASGKNGDPIAQGWKFHLADATRLTVRPFRLAESHDWFDKVIMTITVHDRTGAKLAMLDSDKITAGNWSHEFEIDEDVAKKMLDVVIWFREP